MESKNNIVVTVKVDDSQVQEAISKASELVELLKTAKSLAHDLTVCCKGIKLEIEV